MGMTFTRREGNGNGNGRRPLPALAASARRRNGHGHGRGWGDGDGTLHLYLRRISEIPLIPREEERRLAVRAARGDERALAQLVEANLRFVVKVALHYRGCGLSILDLIGEGNVGLVRAARRFSPAYDVRFITYAAWWVRRGIVEALARCGGPVRLPVRKARLASQINRASAAFAPAEGAGPEPDGLAAYPPADRAELEAILRARAPTVSLDEGPDASDRLSLLIGGERGEEPWAAAERRAALGQALGSLSRREEQVLGLRFGLEGEPMSLEEIGRRFRLSRERIRQIEQAATGRLRHGPSAKTLRELVV